jgi:hypothetical protein
LRETIAPKRVQRACQRLDAAPAGNP